MIVRNGYVCRKTGKDDNGKLVHRDWWLVKYSGTTLTGKVHLEELRLPKEYLGQKIRLKLEIMEEKK